MTEGGLSVIVRLDIHLNDEAGTGGRARGPPEQEEREISMLNISHFSKTYPGGKRAVEDLSLAVPAGQIVGFIGHNGAGKTTTLRCAAGILDFSEGTIEIDGHDIRREPVAAKQVTAFLPDNPDLYEFMTGVQYLTFIADIYGIPAGERTRRVQEYAGAFELTAALGSAIGSYSHGMKQKLALISALMRKPRLLSLDVNCRIA